MSNRHWLLLIGAVTAAFTAATPAAAYPEFVRHGYFSCTSCHVSPAGGGILTEYGRSFAAEKLATWTRPDEEKALHGLIAGTQPDWLLLGGNARQIQTYVDSSRAESGRWIAMQRDAEACVVTPPPVAAFTCATYGQLPPAGDSTEPRYGLRKVMVRVDAGDAVALRVGRFFPRYGLMIANHTSPIRAGLGFLPHSETDQVEAAYMSELFEASGYYDFGRIIDLGTGDDERDPRRGFGGTLATFLGGAHRLGVSYRRVDDATTSTQIAGFFGALGLSESAFVLAEVDQKAAFFKRPTATQPNWARSAASHVKFGHDLAKGVVGALVHEVDFKDLTDGRSRSDTYGLGLQWFPRPHVEIEAFYGHVLTRSAFAYASAGYLLVHYYL